MRRRRCIPDVNSLESRLALAPVLAPIPDQFAQEGQVIAVQAVATGTGVTYALVPTLTSYQTSAPPPAGATVDPTSGLFLWRPPSLVQTVPITIQATDATGSTTRVFTIRVFDNAPTIQDGVNAILSAGGTLARVGVFSDRDPDIWTATVDYGDGTGVTPLALAPDKTFTLAHVYSRPGVYTVAVTVTDSQGGQGRAFFTATVIPVTPVTPTPPTPVNPVTPTPPIITPTPKRPVVVITRLTRLWRRRHHHSFNLRSK